MDIDKDEVSVIATLFGFLLMIFGGGRAYEKIEGKITGVKSEIKELKDKPASVTISLCEERRIECDKRIRLQFDAGEKQFLEIKKLIADNDRASLERHEEIMKVLFEMNKQ